MKHRYLISPVCNLAGPFYALSMSEAIARRVILKGPCSLLSLSLSEKRVVPIEIAA